MTRKHARRPELQTSRMVMAVVMAVSVFLLGIAIDTINSNMVVVAYRTVYCHETQNEAGSPLYGLQSDSKQFSSLSSCMRHRRRLRRQHHRRLRRHRLRCHGHRLCPAISVAFHLYRYLPPLLLPAKSPPAEFILSLSCNHEFGANVSSKSFWATFIVRLRDRMSRQQR